MNPIFTNSNANGFRGYWYDEFLGQFDNICEQHLREGRAQAFAFIVYDFHSPTHGVLENHGVFTELDRLSGENLTIFYLDASPSGHTNQKKFYKNLNQIVLDLTGQRPENIPFIVFFDFNNGEVTNFSCVPFRDDQRFILHDLSLAVRNRLSLLEKSKKKRPKKFLKSLLKKTVDQTPTILYGEFISHLVNGIHIK